MSLRAGLAVEASAEVYTDSPGGLESRKYPCMGTGVHGVDGRQAGEARESEETGRLVESYEETREVRKEPGLGGSAASVAQAIRASASPG